MAANGLLLGHRDRWRFAQEVGAVIMQRAHAADATHEGIDHPLREGGGDRGVEGVATLHQNGRTDIRGTGLRADDAFHTG